MKKLPIENPFGAPVYHEETLHSTFEAARLLEECGEPHGTVICADFQEEGRGRLNRPWKTERGKSLLFTILLRYASIPAIPEALTLRTGLAVSLAIESLYPALMGKIKIKWPNDIMAIFPARAGKAGGILIETDGKNVFIGVGINLAQKEFPVDYRSKAASLIQLIPNLGGNSKFDLLEMILSRLYAEIENNLKVEKDGHWREGLLERLYKKGENVVFAEGTADSNCIVEGVLSGIGSSGEILIIPKGEEKERAFITGELRVYG